MKQHLRLLVVILVSLMFVVMPWGILAQRPEPNVAMGRTFVRAFYADGASLRACLSGKGVQAPAPALAPQASLETVTLYPVADACVVQNSPSFNAGNTVDMWVGRDEDDSNMGVLRSLVQFDVSSIPAGTTITSATLRVYLVGYWDYRNRWRTVTSYRLAGAWQETTVNWNNCPAYAETYGSVDTISNGVWQYYDLDVTALAQAWISGAYPNYGLMLRGPEISGAESSTRVFYTREGEYKPQLVIVYGAAANTPTPTRTVTATSQPGATPSPTTTPASPKIFGGIWAPMVLRPLIPPTPTPTLTPAATATPTREPSWRNIMTENFEGSFPRGDWEVEDLSDDDGGEYLWDEDDFKPHQGGKSAWPANGGDEGLDPANHDYPNDLYSWMVYGPFDLRGAAVAELNFWYWLESESCCDLLYWGVSVNNEDFYGDWDAGSSGGWVQEQLNLAEWLGEDEVWVAFVFSSDYSITDQGAFVDDIVLRKASAAAGLDVTPPTPARELINITRAQGARPE